MRSLPRGRTRLARVACLAALVWALLPARAGALELVDVPLDHWSYDVVERLQVRAGLGRTLLLSRPLSRGDMALEVRELEAASSQGHWSPSPVDQQQLEMLHAEFSEELAAPGDSSAVLQRAHHVWSRSGWRFQAFWRGRQKLDHGLENPPGDLPQTDARLVLQPAAALQIGPHLLAFEQIDYRVRTGDASFMQGAGDNETEYVFDPADRFTIMRSDRPQVRFGCGRWRLELSRSNLRWGPGRFNAMLIQDATPPFDQLRLRADFGRVRFTSLAGQLRGARLVPSDPEFAQKFLAAHRLEIAVHPRLLLAASEALVYGNRGLDLSYLNPLSVLFVAQANNGDRDNALTSIDGRLLLPGGAELYGECVVDDLNLRRGLRDYGNKLGLLAGLLWSGPLGARDWDLEAEWSWAGQFLYTHVLPVNRFQQFGAALGSRTGPDSDLWVVGARRLLSRGWSARFFYALERHGEGSLAVAHDQRTSDQQDYLSGTVESRHQPGLELRYRGLRSLELGLDYRFVSIRQAHHDPSHRRLEMQQVALEARLEL